MSEKSPLLILPGPVLAEGRQMAVWASGVNLERDTRYLRRATARKETWRL